MVIQKMQFIIITAHNHDHYHRRRHPMTTWWYRMGIRNPGCNFMFPDDTDPNFTETLDVSKMQEMILLIEDVLQSCWTHVFSLEPGAVNYITIGVVWARASEGNNFASVEKMKLQ